MKSEYIVAIIAASGVVLSALIGGFFGLIKKKNKAENSVIQNQNGQNNTQILTQNNFGNLTPVEACELTVKLFNDNFPKLQEQARQTVDKKVNELMKSIAEQLQVGGIVDMTPLGYPDVQYAVYEAQKNYARLGTQEMLETLSRLVVSRIKHNEESVALKVSIDKAIEIAPLLNSEQLDLLSLLFLCCKTHITTIKTLDDLKEHINSISEAFGKADFDSFLYLNMLGCLQLNLHNTDEQYAKQYNFDIEDVRAICTDVINKTTGDYSTSHIGTILAIANIEAKMNMSLDPKIWIG